MAVARNRCDEVFQHPEAITLWNLPTDIEDQFDSRWARWLEGGEVWRNFFKALESPPSDLLSALKQLELLSPHDEDILGRLRRSAEGRAVRLVGKDGLNDDLIRLLAAAFSLGEPGKPAIPYALLGDEGG